MTPAHFAQLCSDFNLGEPLGSQVNTVGNLNANFVIKTNQGRFFVKSIREKRKLQVPYIAAVERFMEEKGIPAIGMLRTENGTESATYDEATYTVYPYLEHGEEYVYSPDDYQALGEMLARIHTAGSREVPENLLAHSWKGKSLDVVREQLTGHAARLKSISRSPIDDTFLAYITFKLERLNTLEGLTLLRTDTLVHGDYHGRNVLFDEGTRQIRGICDWEQAAMSDRSYELARSLLYTCFEGTWERTAALASSERFLSGYQSIVPLTRAEFATGMKARLERMLAAVWIEHEFYVLGNARANQFIPHEIRLIEEFVDGDLLEEVLDLLTD